MNDANLSRLKLQNFCRRLARLATGACVVGVLFSTLLANVSGQTAQKTSVEARRANQREVGVSKSPEAEVKPASNVGAEISYAYDFKQPNFLVSQIRIEHNAEGRGQIRFKKRNSEENFTEPLTLSPTALLRITELWAKLDGLKGAPNLQAEKQFPHLGTMTLSISEGEQTRATEFNWTNNPDASALVSEYRHLADQSLFVFDINVARDNQPLEAPSIMKRLEMHVRRKELSDPTQLLPLLRELSTDERLPLIARNQASTLVKKLDKK